MNRLLHHLRAGLSDPDGGELTDGQLLEAYVVGRDGAPFAALVRRHGPMVWGVCRRLLLSPQDAEDAFQATFLVLVRKAASVVPRHMVGNWLYGVAYQTALKARFLAARRRARERQGADMPEPETAPPDSWPDLQPVLDQELARLPARYRAVVVLCDLEGKTRHDAARHLRVPDGTVAGWLARGRALLAKRLTRRGITLSGTALTAALAQNTAPATVPAFLLSTTIEAAALFAAGPAAAGAIPPAVVTLTEGVLKSMLLTKLKASLAILAVAGVLGLGLTGLAFQATAGEGSNQQPPAGKSPERPATVAGPADELRQLREEIAKLRAEMEILKKQRPADAPVPRVIETTARPTLKVEVPDAKLSIRVYQVKDLISESVDDPAMALIKVITTAVEPETWNAQGGTGSIEYFPVGLSLVIRQTPPVHEQVILLLEELRKAKLEAAPKK